jgi:hypothetical protein
MPGPLGQQLWTSNDNEGRRLNPRRRRKQRENQQRLKCERRKERRDENQSRRRWGKRSRSKTFSGDILYPDFEQKWFDCMAMGTEPNLPEFLPTINSTSGSVHWRSIACLQAQQINISDISSGLSLDHDELESEPMCYVQRLLV